MLNRWVDPLGVDDPSLELRLWQIITSWPPFKAALLLASLAFIYYYLAFCPQRMTMTSIICRDINAPCRQPSTNKDWRRTAWTKIRKSARLREVALFYSDFRGLKNWYFLKQISNRLAQIIQKRRLAHTGFVSWYFSTFSPLWSLYSVTLLIIEDETTDFNLWTII